jgi:hypothetical protein
MSSLSTRLLTQTTAHMNKLWKMIELKFDILEIKTHYLNKGDNLIMISIDQIKQREYLSKYPFNYLFPTIAFKFQNTGTATALLWQFAVNVLYAEIDPTPMLDFEADIKDNELRIEATNNGWGTAYDCLLQIDETSLNQLLVPSEKEYKGTVLSGKKQTVFYLTKDSFDTYQYKKIGKKFRALTRVSLIERLRGIKPVSGIKLEDLYVTWSHRDEKGKKNSGKQEVYNWTGKVFILTQNGFQALQQPHRGGGAPSDVTFSVILDSLEAPYEQLYPVTRQVPSGGIEHFHIMIGAPKSCHLRIRFKFFFDNASIDDNKVVQSSEFDVELWNPRSSEWHYFYKDKEELKRKLDEMQAIPVGDNFDFQWIQEEIRKIQQQLSNYPFIEAKDHY